MNDSATPWYRAAHPVSALVSAKSGSLLVIASEEIVSLMHTETRTILAEYADPPSPVEQVAIVPDGSLLAIARRALGIQVIDPQTGTLLHTYNAYTGAVSALAFAPGGKYLASASAPRRLRGPRGLAYLSVKQQPTIKVWEAANGKDQFLHSGHDRKAFALAWSLDGDYVASGGDEYIDLWNAQNGCPLVSYEGHTHRISRLAFSPDGQTIASVSLDSTLQVWSPWQISSSAPKLFEYRSGKEELLAVAWSPDGKLIAVGGRDGGVQVVDHCARPVFRQKAHRAAVSAVVWSGNQLFSAGEDHTVRLWQMPIETPDWAQR